MRDEPAAVISIQARTGTRQPPAGAAASPGSNIASAAADRRRCARAADVLVHGRSIPEHSPDRGAGRVIGAGFGLGMAAVPGALIATQPEGHGTGAQQFFPLRQAGLLQLGQTPQHVARSDDRVPVKTA